MSIGYLYNRHAFDSVQEAERYHDPGRWEREGRRRQDDPLLAIALARVGRDVLLVDGDEQGTALAFTELRSASKGGSPGYAAVALHGAALRTQVRQLAPKYADVVIDVDGRDTGSLRAALTVADVVLVPVKQRSFDLWGAEQTADLIHEAREINSRLRAVAVLNEADVQGKDNEAAAKPCGNLRDWSTLRCGSCAARRSQDERGTAATLGSPPGP